MLPLRALHTPKFAMADLDLEAPLAELCANRAALVPVGSIDSFVKERAQQTPSSRPAMHSPMENTSITIRCRDDIGREACP